MNKYRIGQGFDVHEFQEGRKLFLGGVEIPYKTGLLGHSDADVLLHAICDALLGALALGDIGVHFPNTDERFKGIDSKELLRQVMNLIKSKGYRVVNTDSTLILQKPKIAEYVPEMQRIISEIIEVETDRVSIKATTSEKMGFTGREEGAVAQSIALLKYTK
ncbi:MAG: 2-C-methyl-D-erythritol 2,4-cyclodiphosphate synthase [Ignavibacteriales bacterium]|jgi:2-C-methyl-D-erythritol 2,4-cyclodiphosphate synthase|nr:2-C-methyl-D-erythritol 2,4-cyclodiphosphate synthase [Ignavibacteriaceae bacterium]NLH59791.1 2-C-methyl-D-erythritol 2,4-cyclodiphosphate synthase [Ignavibacteriales bacterium]HOJ18376.1 2-C-methyl-D-erythritol 2,4-cyclodiphosphate synthase [Ignavibacteriaceae bacterium]